MFRCQSTKGIIISYVLYHEKLRNKISKSCGVNCQKVAEFYCKVICF